MNKITATKAQLKQGVLLDNSHRVVVDVIAPNSIQVSSEEDVVEIDTNPRVFGPGVWFTLMSMAARSRTHDAIKNFIGFALPVMANLLCSTCSKHSRKNLMRRHPSNYLNRRDHRGENIGMWLWVYDFHNDVNAIANPSKDLFPLDHALAIYEPILRLTTSEIEADFENAQNIDTVDSINHFTFVDDDEVDVTYLEPTVQDVQTPSVPVPLTANVNRLLHKPMGNTLPQSSMNFAQRGYMNGRSMQSSSRVMQPCTTCGIKK